MPARLLLALGLSLSASAAEPAPVDAGRPMPPGTPVALVVATPGLSPAAHQPLVDALEAEGLDAWLLVLDPEHQDLQDAVETVLPAARAALPSARHALVGHGLGGTLAAQAATRDPPLALALLGAPLAFPSSALATWLCEQPVPAGGVDLSRQGEARWNGLPVLETLLGSPLPELDRVGAAWLGDLCAWGAAGEAVDLRTLAAPVWVGVGDLDELGPPERVRPWLPPQAEFVRFGLLRLDTREYRSVDLLAEGRPARALAGWLSEQVRTVP